MKRLPTVVVICTALIAVCIGPVFGDAISVAARSLEVDLRILNFGGTAVYYVGDRFYYNITVTNIGKEPIQSTLTVKIHNPEKDVIGAIRTFERDLNVGQSTNLVPALSGNEVNVYFFDISGTYRLEILSSTPVRFYRMGSETDYDWFDDRYTFYFEASSYYQKLWEDRLYELQIEAKQLDRESLQLQKRMLTLTNAVVLLTLVNLMLFAGTVGKGRTKVLAAVLVAYVVIFVLAYLGWLVFPFS